MRLIKVMKKLYILLCFLSISCSGCTYWTIKDKLIITKTIKEGALLKTEHKEKQNSINKFDKSTHDILIKKIAAL
jgi:hypothetical protein